MIRLEGGNEYCEGSEDRPCDERARAAFDSRTIEREEARAAREAPTPSVEIARLARIALFAAKLRDDNTAEAARNAAEEVRKETKRARARVYS